MNTAAKGIANQPLLNNPSAALPQEQQPSLGQRLLNLPIQRKQWIALWTSELVSVIGFVSVGTFLMVEIGRSQLVNQAQSELVTTAIHYNAKVNQMTDSFRGQSNSSIMVAAAKVGAKDITLDSELKGRVLKSLQNEVKSRNIEYATLVDKNLRIVANANTNRVGERFDPNNLVSQALKKAEPIQSSEIVSWTELAKESPPLPEGFSNQDALVRYTVTPIKDPDTDAVIGAIVLGDIVNGKRAIATDTVQAFGGGYSGVYLRQPTGQYTLATSLDQAQGANLNQANPNVALPNTALLEAATQANGKPVTERLQVGGQTYTMAAKTLANSAGQPVAVLLRGTPETSLNELIRNSLLLQLMVVALTIAVTLLLAIWLRRAIAKPIQRLRQIAQQFFTGNVYARADVVAADEVGQLSVVFNAMADKIANDLEEMRHKDSLLPPQAAQPAHWEEEAARRQEAEKLAEEQRFQKEVLQKRVLELLQEIDPVSQGDLTIKATVSPDEIGTIADSYNAIVDHLRRIVGHAQEAANQVVAATAKNGGYIQGLSSEASQQTTEIAAALAQVKGMTAVAQDVAANAEQAKAVVLQATQTVEAGDAAMNRTVDGIRSIRATVAETAKKVKHLGESSQKISTVVELISNFAEQTKMLALNASIEAALAGEGGRGFSVVADEVRTLARQSAEATEEIRKLVVSIQAETNEVVAAMETGTEQVVIGTKLVDETRQSLNKITVASSQISQLIGAIAQSTVVQSQTSETVTQTMNNIIAAISDKNSTETSQVASSFEHLHKIAQTLQDDVSQFKVS